MSDAQRIILDTLRQAPRARPRLFGYSRRCDRHFDVPVPALIAARGADSPVVTMRPVICAGCGGRETEIRIKAPCKGS